MLSDSLFNRSFLSCGGDLLSLLCVGELTVFESCEDVTAIFLSLEAGLACLWLSQAEATLFSISERVLLPLLESDLSDFFSLNEILRSLGIGIVSLETPNPSLHLSSRWEIYPCLFEYSTMIAGLDASLFRSISSIGPWLTLLSRFGRVASKSAFPGD